MGIPNGNHRYMAIGLLILLFSTSLAIAVFGGQFEDAVTAYDLGDYSTAYRLMKPLAEKGQVTAQYNLGVMYFKGEGVQQNYAEAAKWYRKAAEQGYAKAQYDLGVMFQHGQGVRQNYDEAVKWYHRAAEQGYAPAQHNLGFSYYKGKGVHQNYAEAAKWYLKAAEQGYAKAQYNLGLLYYNGQGVTQNYILAHMWLDLAVLHFPTEMREEAVKSRDLVASKMTPAHIEEAQRMAQKWKPKKEGQ